MTGIRPAWLLPLLLATLPCAHPAHALFAAEPAPLTVVASTTVLADIVRQVGGARVVVTSLLAPGIDGHTWQPAPGDVQRIAAARLVVVNGLGFEGWLDQVIANAGNHPQVVVASAGVAARGGDPHAWQDVRNGMRYAQAIATALTAADPAGADDYAAWTEAYLAQLRVVDAWVRKQIATLPPTARVLVTSHDALGYYGQAYGLEVIAVDGIATGQEPDPRHIADLIALLRARRVRSVFIESVANPKVVEQIGAEGGAVPGGTLYSDSLDRPGTPAGTYIGMFLTNTRTIVDGLR